MKDDIGRFVECFKRCGIGLTGEQYRRFWDFHVLLRGRNREFDLTRIRGMEDMVVKHYVDSLMVLELTALESPVLDIGTGPGFPGIPLKIGKPDLNIILAEGRARRVEFLKEACRLLGFEDVILYPHKVSRTFSMPVRTVITRAFEPMGDTLRRVGGFLGKGARVVFMKGPGCGEELEAACAEFEEEYQLTSDIPYMLPTTSHARRLVVFERTGELMRFAIQKEESDARNPGMIDEGRGTPVREITSSINDTYKMFQRILSGKGIRKTGMALVSGTKQVLEILRDFPEKSMGLIQPMNSEFPESGMPASTTLYRLHPELFRNIDLFGTGRPILLVRVEAPHPWTVGDSSDGCTLFIPCQDPDNVGSLIRSAAALGVQRVVLLREAASPWHPKSIRVAGSALFRIPMFSGPSISELDRTGGLPLVVLSPEGEDIGGFRFPPSFGLVPGLEGQGVPHSLRSGLTLSIPMSNRTESLNTAVASAIALYLWRRQQTHS